MEWNSLSPLRDGQIRRVAVSPERLATLYRFSFIPSDGRGCHCRAA